MLSLNRLTKLAISIPLTDIIAVLAFSAIKGEIEKRARDVYEKRSMLAVLDGRERNFLELKTDRAMIEQNLPTLKEALPQESDIDNVVTDLESVARRTGNDQVLNFDPLASASDLGSMKSIGFSANLSGNLPSFSLYLSELEKLPYPIEISSVNVLNDSGSLSGGSRLNLTAKLYYRK